jgi:hypothetical protein
LFTLVVDLIERVKVNVNVNIRLVVREEQTDDWTTPTRTRRNRSADLESLRPRPPQPRAPQENMNDNKLVGPVMGKRERWSVVRTGRIEPKLRFFAGHPMTGLQQLLRGVRS